MRDHSGHGHAELVEASLLAGRGRREIPRLRFASLGMTLCLALALCFVAAIGGEPAGPLPAEVQFKTLDLKFVTPHLPLLKKHAKGEVKAFFLVPANGTLGHVRELVQRADMACDYCAVAKPPAPPDALDASDVAEFGKRLAAAQPQVLVTLGIRWHTGLKGRLIGELLGRVREGMGAAVAVRDLKEEPELAAALGGGKEVAEPPLPAVAVAVPAVRRFALGKGRVALVVCPWASDGGAGEAALGDWTALRLPREVARIEALRWRGFEYSYAFLADLARWAAGQESGIAVSDAALKADNVLVAVRNAGEKVMTRVYVTVRTRRWEARAQGEVPAELAPGESRHLVTLNRAPDGGPLALEVHVRGGDGRTLAFGSLGASAYQAVTLNILPDSPFRPAGKPGACVVELQGALPGGKLDVTVEDRFGRLVDRSTHVVQLAEGKARVASLIQGVQPLSAYHEVVARFYSLDAPERVVAEASADLFLLPEGPQAEGLGLGVWEAPGRSALALQGALRTAHDLGFTLHSHSSDDRVLYATGGLKAAYAPVGLAPETAKEEWQKSVRPHYDRGARLVGLGVGPRLPEGFETNPQTLAAFRDWLRKRYADIAELNKAWGAQFADFAQVVPKSRKDLGASPNLAPWLEFRMFLGEVIGERCMKAPADWAADLAPDLAVGEWGLAEPSADWPVDWSRYAKCYRVAARRAEPQGVLEDLFRSFAPEARLGVVVDQGMAEPSPALRLAPWLALMGGGSLAWFWQTGPDGSPRSAVLTSDQRPAAGAAMLAKEVVPEITGGADSLLLASKFSPDPIAIAYSYPSWLADPAALARGAKTVVEELGFQHLYVAMDDVAAGRLEKDGFKLLVVQQASCLSKEQADGVRRFVEAGGVLLCVGRSGWRDLRGAPHAEGSLLDALAGVDTSKAKPLGRTLSTPSGEPLLTLAVAEGGVAAKEASTLASAALDEKTLLPVWTQRDLGKGKVYWLNTAVAPEEPEAVRRSHWDIFDHVIGMAGVKPRCRFYAGEQPLFGGETWYFETPSGRTLLVGHCFGRKVEGYVAARFRRKGIVYEAIASRAVGEAEGIQDTFPEGTMRLYAVLDYRCTGLAVKAEGAKANPGDVVRVNIALKISSKDPAKTADLHPIRLRIHGPSGDLPECRRVVMLQGGEAAAEFRLALDQAPGAYAILAQDAISGLEGRAALTVLKPDPKGR
ncbi:MAG: hypothetical protein FJ291_08690 [Planctomycetes bacterium]|nr:hypothetical protein [Planctomycetota bacterium]